MINLTTLLLYLLTFSFFPWYTLTFVTSTRHQLFFIFFISSLSFDHFLVSISPFLQLSVCSLATTHASSLLWFHFDLSSVNTRALHLGILLPPSPPASHPLNPCNTVPSASTFPAITQHKLTSDGARWIHSRQLMQVTRGKLCPGEHPWPVYESFGAAIKLNYGLCWMALYSPMRHSQGAASGSPDDHDLITRTWARWYRVVRLNISMAPDHTYTDKALIRGSFVGGISTGSFKTLLAPWT